MDFWRIFQLVFCYFVISSGILQIACRNGRNKLHRNPLFREKARQNSQIAWLGYPAELTCPLDIQGGSMFPISWKKDDMDIEEYEDTRFDISQDGQRLTIFDSASEDSGVYTCQATFGDGPVQRNIRLTIADAEHVQGPLLMFLKKTAHLPEDSRHRNLFGSAPHFTERDTEKSLQKLRPIGQDVNLKCRAEGVPEPDIQWYKNGQPITRTSEFQPGKRKAYVLENLSEADNGNYTCVASNYFGNISRTYSVAVDTCTVEKPTISSSAPVDPFVMVNGEVTLQCIVDSCREAPSIKWFKQNPGNERDTVAEFKPADFTGPIHDCKVMRHEKPNRYRCAYTMNNFTAQDVGVYACYAFNQLRLNDIKLIPLMLQDDFTVDHERQNETMRYLYYTLGGIVTLIVVCLTGACCCVCCGRPRPEKTVFSPPRSTSSSFKRATAPDYIVTDRQLNQHYDVGQYSINICHSATSPSSNKGHDITTPVTRSLLENSSPDHSVLKYDGIATEYEEVEEEDFSESVYTGHPPSFVSGYAGTRPLHHYR